MIIIRIGEGQSETGKILDYNTQWFTNKKETIEYHLKTKNQYLYHMIKENIGK